MKNSQKLLKAISAFTLTSVLLILVYTILEQFILLVIMLYLNGIWNCNILISFIGGIAYFMDRQA